ncbi:inner membrane protein, partial [mine drainage metagenome]
CPGRIRDESWGGRAKPGPHFELIDEWRDQMAPGLYWIGPPKGDQLGELAPPVWVCDALKIEAATRDAQGGEWGRLLRFKDQDGQQKQWSMPMRMLAAGGEELRAELLAAGLRLAPSAAARAALANYLGREHPTARARCVARTGWHGNSFVLPAETLGTPSGEHIIFQAPSLAPVALGQAGTLGGWIESVSAPCAGNSRLVLAIAAAFAAPCLGLLELEGGGIHLRGSSSCGKTTALQMAASAFGGAAYMGTWRQTDNGLEGTAALHSDLLLI